jgi:BolA family transcriptional regulator, general stress-responsive regulator
MRGYRGLSRAPSIRYGRSMQRAMAIQEKLSSAFAPSRLEVLNESDDHKGPPGRETHFRVVVVSNVFENKSLIARHKLVYAALGDELRAGLHALAIVTKTEIEWEGAPNAGQSPHCASKVQP